MPTPPYKDLQFSPATVNDPRRSFYFDFDFIFGFPFLWANPTVEDNDNNNNTRRRWWPRSKVTIITSTTARVVPPLLLFFFYIDHIWYPFWIPSFRLNLRPISMASISPASSSSAATASIPSVYELCTVWQTLMDCMIMCCCCCTPADPLLTKDDLTPLDCCAIWNLIA